MGISSLFTETFTRIQTTPVIGDIGGVTYTTAETTAYPCYLEPRTGTEDLADANRQVGDWRLWLPPDADITGWDQGTALGRTFDIIAPPRPFNAPAGSDDMDHIEVDLREVT